MKPTVPGTVQDSAWYVVCVLCLPQYRHCCSRHHKQFRFDVILVLNLKFNKDIKVKTNVVTAKRQMRNKKSSPSSPSYKYPAPSSGYRQAMFPTASVPYVFTFVQTPDCMLVRQRAAVSRTCTLPG